MNSIQIMILLSGEIVFSQCRVHRERVVEEKKTKYYPSAMKMSAGNSLMVDMPQNILGTSSDHKTSSCSGVGQKKNRRQSRNAELPQRRNDRR